MLVFEAVHNYCFFFNLLYVLCPSPESCVTLVSSASALRSFRTSCSNLHRPAWCFVQNQQTGIRETRQEFTWFSRLAAQTGNTSALLTAQVKTNKTTLGWTYVTERQKPGALLTGLLVSVWLDRVAAAVSGVSPGVCRENGKCAREKLLGISSCCNMSVRVRLTIFAYVEEVSLNKRLLTRTARGGFMLKSCYKMLAHVHHSWFKAASYLWARSSSGGGVSYLCVCRAFPVDDLVVQIGKLFPHGAVGAGHRVGDEDVQDTSSGTKIHFAWRTHSS